MLSLDAWLVGAMAAKQIPSSSPFAMSLSPRCLILKPLPTCIGGWSSGTRQHDTCRLTQMSFPRAHDEEFMALGLEL